MTDEAKSYKYDVFISYSRKNEAFASKLEQALESYKPEKDLKVPQRFIETFRDKEDFTGGDYHKSLLKNLNNSSKLIVICSPEARKSLYVNDEIKQFVAVRGSDHIIPVLFSGIPNNEAKAGQEDQMAFPDELCKAVEMPLAVNYLGFDAEKDKINKGIFTDSWYSILADTYELSRSEMEQREKRRRVRKRRITISALSGSLLVLSVLLIFALVSRSQALDARNEAEAAREEEKKRKEEAEEAKTDAEIQRNDAIEARNEAKAALDRETEAKDNETKARELADTKRKEAEQAAENERIAKNQAEERRKQAEEATENERIAKNQAEERRQEAEAQTEKANDALRASYTENGRQELLNYRPFSATSYLNAAYQIPLKDGSEGKISSLLFLLGQSMKSIDSLRFSLEHQAAVSSAEFSPDGKKIVTRSNDKTAKVWDVETREVLPLLQHQGNVSSAKFSPDGKKIVTASNDSTAKVWDVKIWDVETGKVLVLSQHQGNVSSAEFSPDSKKIVTGSTDRTAKVWDVATEKVLASFDHQAYVYSVEFSPDGKKILIVGSDDTAKLWDVATGKVLASFEHQDKVNSAEFSPDGNKVVTASNNGTVKLWDVKPEIRTPQEINEIVDKKVPLRLVNGVLVPR